MSIFLTTVGVFGVPSTRADSITGSTITIGIEPPEYLYHWTSYSALELIADEAMRSGGKWQIFRHHGQSSFSQKWPQFLQNGHGMLFLSPDPLRLKGGEMEYYGDVLIKIKINRKQTRAAHLKVGTGAWQFEQPAFTKAYDFSKIDLAYNDQLGEWILLNPRAIESFTADPDTLKSELEHHLRNLKDPNFEFPEGRFSWKDSMRAARRIYTIGVIEQLLLNGHLGIPDFFLNQSEKGESTNSARSIESSDLEKKIRDVLVLLMMKRRDRIQRLESQQGTTDDLFKEILIKMLASSKGNISESLLEEIKTFSRRELPWRSVAPGQIDWGLKERLKRVNQIWSQFVDDKIDSVSAIKKLKEIDTSVREYDGYQEMDGRRFVYFQPAAGSNQYRPVKKMTALQNFFWSFPTLSSFFEPVEQKPSAEASTCRASVSI